jgi:hypothetical protein
VVAEPESVAWLAAIATMAAPVPSGAKEGRVFVCVLKPNLIPLAEG